VRGLLDLINLSCRFTVGYLTARKNEVELLTIKLYANVLQRLAIHHC